MSQFKIGDWVCDLYGKIIQLTDAHFTGVTQRNTEWFNRLTPWTPSIGDWCWKDTEFVKITHIADHNREDGLLTYSCSVLCRAEFFSSSFIPEPFIGTLPTGAK